MSRCYCCGSTDQEIVLEMPALPLTGYYVAPGDTINEYHFDQAVQLCKNCGHGQLKNIVNPEYLYNSAYSHRGSLSPIASGGNHFFLKYLLENISGDKQSIIDIGCNDLLLMKLIKEKVKAEHYYGLDPIWIGKDHTDDGVKVLGKFSDKLSAGDINGKLDLVVSCHTFEHIPDPSTSIARIAELCSDNADFFIEVPSMETLIELNRIDQIFHQHVNYYSVNSLIHLMLPFGFGYQSHTFNYDMWGGTMLVHFRRNKPANDTSNIPKITSSLFLGSLTAFRKQVSFFNEQVKALGTGISFYGAAQMLPVLLYHINNPVLDEAVIYDDNTSRIGLRYPHLKHEIRKTPETLNGISIVITALDSYRPIFSKLTGLHPKRIVDILTIK